MKTLIKTMLLALGTSISAGGFAQDKKKDAVKITKRRRSSGFEIKNAVFQINPGSLAKISILLFDHNV